MNAIVYGLNHGWKPEINNCDLYIGMDEHGFLELK